MKTRNGFVSNSSSASFVVVWRCLEDHDTLENTIGKLFGLTFNSKQKVSWKTNGFNNKNLVADALEVEKHTHKRGKNYETFFSTVMYNDMDSFGTAPKSLLMALATNEGAFELLYSNVHED